MATTKVSDWINKSVPDDAVWGQYYVIARKEEFQNGSRIQIEQTVCPARDATITGKEIKAHLENSASPALEVGLIIAGIVLAVVAFLLRKPLGASTGFSAIEILINLVLVICGIYFLTKACNQAPEIQDRLNPYIEEALTQKVFFEEEAKGLRLTRR